MASWVCYSLSHTLPATAVFSSLLCVPGFTYSKVITFLASFNCKLPFFLCRRIIILCVITIRLWTIRYHSFLFLFWLSKNGTLCGTEAQWELLAVHLDPDSSIACETSTAETSSKNHWWWSFIFVFSKHTECVSSPEALLKTYFENCGGSIFTEPAKWTVAHCNSISLYGEKMSVNVYHKSLVSYTKSTVALMRTEA